MGDRNEGAFLALTQTIVRDTVGSTTHERRIAITNVTDIDVSHATTVALAAGDYANHDVL